MLSGASDFWENENIVLGVEMKKNIGRVVFKIMVVVCVGTIIGLLYYHLYSMLINDRYNRLEWESGERTLYMFFAVFIGIIYNYLFDVLKGRSTKVFVSLGLASVFTVSVFFINNYFRYLHWNSVLFNWRHIFPYNIFLKSDIAYKVGYGEYRYIVAFLAMCLSNLAIILLLKRVVPLLTKWIRKWGYRCIERAFKVREDKEARLEYCLQRLINGADYIDFVCEIDSMPIDNESKEFLIKLINKYDGNRETIKLYQALFTKYKQLLSQEEYLKYRQRYIKFLLKSTS